METEQAEDWLGFRAASVEVKSILLDAMLDHHDTRKVSHDELIVKVNEFFDILRDCDSSVPDGYGDDDILQAIIHKYDRYYEAMFALITHRLKVEHNLSCVVEPSWEDTSIIVVVERQKEKDYVVVFRYQKARNLGFENAEELASDLITGAKDIAEFLENDLDK